MPDEVAADGSWVAWRLAGGNNRELGRSAAVFADIAACRAAAAALRDDLGLTRRITAMNDSTGLWGWRLESGGRSVAVAGRLYLRQRECHYSLAQFVAAVPKARLSGHVVYLTRPLRDGRDGRDGPDRDGRDDVKLPRPRSGAELPADQPGRADPTGPADRGERAGQADRAVLARRRGPGRVAIGVRSARAAGAMTGSP
jgi:hypothetical protein